MQYDLKTIGQSALVKIKWHGAPTRVLVRGEGEKREVATGDVLEVTAEQAKELLNINRLFTLEGDKPMKQASPVVLPETKDPEGNTVATLTAKTALDLKTKKEIVEALKTLDIKFNEALSKADLLLVLTEELEAREKQAQEDKEKAEKEAEELEANKQAGAVQQAT